MWEDGVSSLYQGKPSSFSLAIHVLDGYSDRQWGKKEKLVNESTKEITNKMIKVCL